MPALYELALLGTASQLQIDEIGTQLAELIAPFRLTLGSDVAWHVMPSAFAPSQTRSAAALFAGAPGASDAGLARLLRDAVPIIPVASRSENFQVEILRPLNGLSYLSDGPRRIASALLECAGLLPRQRRVFVSYRREESRAAALQLFDALSARLFDVFLDTHGIAPGEDFQNLLWHRLCDCDVLVMLDTPGYFGSRWAEAEFGRAQAKGIAILRVGWPGCVVSPRAVTAGQLDLAGPDIEPATGRMTEAALERICYELEAQRSKSIAVRHLNLVSGLQIAIERVGGSFEGVGPHKGIYIRLPMGTPLVVFPTIGNPTSVTLHEAAEQARDTESAVLFDSVGLHDRHLGHLSWLSGRIPQIRLIKAHEAAWQFGGWNAR